MENTANSQEKNRRDYHEKKYSSVRDVFLQKKLFHTD